MPIHTARGGVTSKMTVAVSKKKELLFCCPPKWDERSDDISNLRGNDGLKRQKEQIISISGSFPGSID